MNRFFLRSCAALFLLCLFSQNIHAQLKTWTGAVSTDWSEGGNWTPVGVPTAANDITIPAVANDPVATGIALALNAGKTLAINAGATLTMDGQNTPSEGLRIDGLLVNDGILEIKNIDGPALLLDSSGSANNNEGGSISIDGTNGAFSFFALGGTGSFLNDGLIEIGKTTPVTGSALSPLGSVTFTNGDCGLLHIFSDIGFSDFGSMTNNGTIIENHSGNSSVNINNGIIYNLNGGTFNVNSGSAALTSLPNIFTWTGATDTDWNKGCNWDSGLVPDGTQQDVVVPDVTNDPVATGIQIDVNSGSVLTVENGGVLTINGQNVANACLQNEGTVFVDPGGILTVDSSFSDGIINTGMGVFNNSGTIEVGGISASGYIGTTGIANNNANSTFNNSGMINITGTGVRVPAAGRGIFNFGGIFNNNGGTTNIDNTTSDGINNTNSATFNHTGGTINIGLNNPIGFQGIFNFNSTFLNQATLNIQQTGVDGIQNTNGGMFTNDGGNIVISNTSVSSIANLTSTAVFNNSNDGTIDLSQTGNNGNGIFTSGVLTNESGGLITANNISNVDLFIANSGSFNNGTCSSFFGSDEITVQAGLTLTNSGYININRIFNSGTFDNTNGFVHDASANFDCGINGGTCLGAPITHAQFIADNDMDMTAFCSGDLDDLGCLPASLQVTNTNDAGFGSLRYIINCAEPGDTITFNAAINTQLIQLNSGQIIIDKNLTIIGNGWDNTIIDGSLDDASRIFQINSGIEVKIIGLTLQNGGGVNFNPFSGGAIINSGSLKLTSCKLSGNKAGTSGAISPNGPASILEAINCVFMGNEAFTQAGVIDNQSSSAIFTNCLISNNISGGAGGALLGGTPLTLNNCTVTKNHAAGIGGGIVVLGDFNMNNSIVAQNTAGSVGPDIRFNSGNVDDVFNNLIGDPAGSGIAIGGMFGNISGDPLFIDALNNDFNLSSASPCINTGDNTQIPFDACDIDADGITAERIEIDLNNKTRIIQGTVDMGVYESCHIPVNTIIYVDINATGANSGFNWTDAYTDLQDALNDAECAPYSTQIWVAAGTYKPSKRWDGDNDGILTPREATFELPDKAQLFGGFAGGETDLLERMWELNPTILSGDIDNDDLNSPAEIFTDILGQNAYHVLVTNFVSDSTGVDGFIVAGGTANGSSPHIFGGGFLNQGNAPGMSSSPYVFNIIFQGNFSSSIGGGLYNRGFNGGTIESKITNCHFEGNSSSRGGAMGNAGNTGGKCNPCITDCTFVNNSGTGFSGAGAILNLGTSGECNPLITNCRFENNTAGLLGGAIHNIGDNAGDASPIITNSIFIGNTAESGGAIYNNGDSGEGNASGNSSPVISNCTFYNNSTIGNGAALYNDAWNNGTASPQISNSVFWNNTAGGIGQTLYNDLGTAQVGTANPVLTNCLVQEAACPNENNGGSTTCGGTMVYATGPLFADAARGFFQLGVGSPAIDMGDNALIAADTCDLDGDMDRMEATPIDGQGFARIDNGTVDMGAFEGEASAVTFRVDMNQQLPIAPEGVFVAGDFMTEAGYPNDWEPGVILMEDPEGDNIFEKTILLFGVAAGTDFEFKYLNGPAGWEDVPVECGVNTTGFFNRTFTSQALALTLPVVCHGECGPCNDGCDMAQDITCGQTVRSSTAAALTEGGLSCDVDLSTAPGVWYSFVGSGGLVTVSTTGGVTDFDTQIGVFTGDCISPVCLIGNNDVDGTRVSFGSVAAADYFIYVTGNGAASGSFQLFVTCNEVCPPDLVLDATHSPLTGVFAAQNTITVTGDVQVNLGANVMLDAPEILLDPTVEVPQGAVLETSEVGCVE